MEIKQNDKESKIKVISNKHTNTSNKNFKTNSTKDIRFIQTNYYLNDFNFYNKNILKMNKLRQEKIKQHKLTIDNDKRNNLMPKILYFNKFIHSQPKPFSKNDYRAIPSTHIREKILIPKNSLKSRKINEYKAIEKAILNTSIEQNSKRHIKRTIKAFDELLQYVDGFKIKNREKRLQNLLNIDNNKNDNNKENNEDDEDELNIENYNFDEFRRQYNEEKLKQKNKMLQTADDIQTSKIINDIDIQIDPNLLANNNNNNENIYITAQNFKNNEDKSKSFDKPKKEINKEKISKNKLNTDRKYLTINNMFLISDDTLVTQIKNLRKNFKKDLYFNRNNFGKFKLTELGLNYPHSFDKNKKYPDYKGNDKEEKKMFNYKSKVNNPRYNYNNIGTFNDKFNKDLSKVSNFYGKEEAKGRFLRNPLISMYSKYIPNYELYKNLKFIENRYTAGNKYSFRLKPIVNNRKNNFDKLATNIFNKEHKAGLFE